jgi:hypothetical protein
VTAVEFPATARELPPGDAPATAALDRSRRTASTDGRRRLVRRLGWAGLLLAFVGTSLVVGLPTDRVVLLGWILAGLVLHAVTDSWSRLGRLLADWLPLAAILLVYDASRGLADGLGMPVHMSEPAAVDRWFTGGVLPTAWLQEHWQADWWAAVASLVYSSHFVVTPLLLGVLWIRDRARWVRYSRLVVALSLAGLVTYVLYPAAPPWLAAREGIVEPVERISGSGWEILGLPRAGALLVHSQGQVNQVAAVPSLHTAFAVLACLVLLPVARHWWQRAALAGYALSMPLVLVWSGEHYVVDTVLGAAYAVGVVLLVPWASGVVAGAWSRTRQPPAVRPAESPA